MDNGIAREEAVKVYLEASKLAASIDGQLVSTCATKREHDLQVMKDGLRTACAKRQRRRKPRVCLRCNLDMIEEGEEDERVDSGYEGEGESVVEEEVEIVEKKRKWRKVLKVLRRKIGGGLRRLAVESDAELWEGLSCGSFESEMMRSE